MVNSELPEQEKRAVIAHEIGHQELHPGYGHFFSARKYRLRPG
ncbi:MAG: ImmA/IrrE family metallo-endopeptidase [Bacillota bacterium]